MPDGIDPYKVLQVDPEAEDEVVQAAYRRLARKYHPDLAGTPEAAARMASINAAWEMIGDQASRAAHDRARAAAPTPTGGASAGSAASSPRPTPAPTPGTRPPDIVSRDWTSGRSTTGSGFDDSMRTPEGHGAAGPPPGRPSGTVLNFGRYAGWSLGEVARHDIEYIEWLDRAPIGRNYRAEVDGILRSTGRRRSSDGEASDRRGLYRRR
ncbi:MAG: DnaJ domain-containing protein [Chloroflexota bacterium]|jgi:curved DNA-binding protein CbpA